MIKNNSALLRIALMIFLAVFLVGFLLAGYFFIKSAGKKVAEEKNIPKVEENKIPVATLATTTYFGAPLDDPLPACSDLTSKYGQPGLVKSCEFIAGLKVGDNVSGMKITSLKATNRMDEISFSGQARISANYFTSGKYGYFDETVPEGAVCLIGLDSISMSNLPKFPDNGAVFCIPNGSELKKELAKWATSSRATIDIQNYNLEYCNFDCTGVGNTAEFVDLVTSTAEIAAEQTANAKEADFQGAVSCLPNGENIIDRESFKFVGSCHAKDKNHVFFRPYCGQDCGLSEMKADPTSFFEIEFNYSADKNHVYFLGNPVVGADTKTFKVFFNNYAKDDKNAYFQDKQLTDADPKTFSVISDSLINGYSSRDKNHIYDKEVLIKGADPDTYRILLASSSPLDDYGNSMESIYGVDKSNVFFDNKIIVGADLKTFKTLPMYFDHFKKQYIYYAEDNMNVYLDGRIIPGADTGTFKVLTEQFFRDDKNVYEFSKDDKYVYQSGKPIAGIDPATFEILVQGYTKDANHVYYDNKIVADADPATFSVIKDKDNSYYYYGKDKKQGYLKNEAIKNSDPATFKVASGFSGDGEYPYSVDSGHVYYWGKAIIGSDSGTFYLLDNTATTTCAYDKNGLYNKDILIVKAKTKSATEVVEVNHEKYNYWSNGEERYNESTCQKANVTNCHQSGGTFVYCQAE